MELSLEGMFKIMKTIRNAPVDALSQQVQPTPTQVANATCDLKLRRDINNDCGIGGELLNVTWPKGRSSAAIPFESGVEK